MLPWALAAAGQASGDEYDDPERAYRLARRGPLASFGHGLAALSFDDDPSAPPGLHSGLVPTGRDGGLPGDEAPSMVACLVALVDPVSRGSVALSGASPEDPLLVDPRYLADGEDRAHLRRGVRHALSLFDQTPLRSRVAGLLSGQLDDDASIDALIDESLGSYHHPAGTCRMGSDADAVVDPRLGVRGAGNLWVADASVMPTLPRALPHATVIAVAERAAELIQTDATARDGGPEPA